MEKYKAQSKYDLKNTIKIMLKLNRKTDSDIIEYLDKSGNKQGTIKNLIRKEINK